MDESPWTIEDPARLADGDPAVIDCVEGRVRVSHARFVAELDPIGRSGRLFRRSRGAGPLEVTLRAALCSLLPQAGGLPLHAAGIALDGRGVAFFGVSGAGKSTLAGLSPHPVLSDELVVVLPERPFALAASGFWGTGEESRTLREAVPLAALVDLAKGASFKLDRLGARDALVRLVPVVMVPPAPALWSAALAVLGRLVKDVPVYRMTWSPARPPWADLETELGRAASEARFTQSAYLTPQP